MLGLNKQEFSVCVQERWTQDDLARYKMVRAYEPVKLTEDWRLIKKQTIYSLEKLCRETGLFPSVVGGHIEKAWRGNLSIMRCLRYLERQKSDVVTMMDYWRMAKRAGLDIWDEHVKLPKNLKREHDRLMEAERIAKNEEKSGRSSRRSNSEDRHLKRRSLRWRRGHGRTRGSASGRCTRRRS